MSTYQKCPKDVHQMAQSIISEFESHKPLSDCGVTLSLLFAYGDRDDETGELNGDAITHHGQRALGLARIVNEKDRVKGNPDAEIILDGDYWVIIDEPVQRALLDHELHHISVKTTKGIIQHDCAGRPKLKMRKHDIEIGWFKCIAERHGKNSMEQQQAARMMDFCGQYFWPQLTQSSITKLPIRAA